MKPILLLPFVLALPVLAGTPAKQAIAPAPSPCLTSWFAGASVGYLTELEAPMYNLHVGTGNSCWALGGWDVSFFGEVGYTQKDEDYYSLRTVQSLAVTSPSPTRSSYTVNQMEDALAANALLYGGSYGYDLQVVPITLNVKFERQLTGNLNAYIGAGLGVAWVDLELSHDTAKLSESDWVFTSQVFAGLNYKVAPNIDVYGGARWIYYSDASVDMLGGGADLKLGSDCLLELGARYKF